MKKIFVTFTFPYTDDDVLPVQNWVKEQTGIDIIINYHDWEEDNQTGFFMVEENNWKTVVSSIHEYGDAGCFYEEPRFDEEDGWLNDIKDADLIK